MGQSETWSEKREKDLATRTTPVPVTVGEDLELSCTLLIFVSEPRVVLGKGVRPDGVGPLTPTCDPVGRPSAPTSSSTPTLCPDAVSLVSVVGSQRLPWGSQVLKGKPPSEVLT